MAGVLCRSILSYPAVLLVHRYIQLRERVHTTNSVDSVLCRIASCEGREKILATFDTTASVLDLRVRIDHERCDVRIPLTINAGRQISI